MFFKRKRKKQSIKYVSEMLKYLWSCVVMCEAAAVVFGDQLVEQQVQFGFQARAVRGSQSY